MQSLVERVKSGPLKEERMTTAAQVVSVAPMSKRVVLLSGIVTLIVGLVAFSVTLGPRSGFLAWGDGFGYFLYARSLVLDFDRDLTNEYEELEARFPQDLKAAVVFRNLTKRIPETGRIAVTWPSGSALVMAPFYALGYGVELVMAALSGRPADSYGLIPQYFYGIGSLVYGLLGFWATFLCCRRVADEKTAYLAALAVVLGGPVVFYIFFNPTYTHASAFGLVSVMTLLWWRHWHGETRGIAVIAVLGLLLGLLVTIRYQNAVFGILLVGLILRDAYRRSPSGAIREAVVGIAACLLPLTLEGLHHVATYGVPSGGLIEHTGGGGLVLTGVLTYKIGFDLTSPDFLAILLSCRHGVFYWTPILAIGFAGLVWAARKESWAWVFLATFLGHIYLLGAHGSFGGHSFGARYLSESGPMLAVGLAVLVRASVGVIEAFWWRIVLGVLVTWNGLLIMAYGLATISRGGCVTFSEMAAGVMQAVTKLVTGG